MGASSDIVRGVSSCLGRGVAKKAEDGARGALGLFMGGGEEAANLNYM